MSRDSQDAVSMRTLLDRTNSLPHSTRSSCDFASLCQKECRVSIFDQHDHSAGSNAKLEDSYVSRFRLSNRPPGSVLSQELKHRLDTRNSRHTRWINMEGWSPGLVDDLTSRFLEDHGCLDLADLGPQTLGGPIRCKDGGYFVWLQTSIWYAGSEATYWSAMKQCRLRIVVCLPTPNAAGTVITNFLDKSHLVDRVSNAFTQELLDNHSMGTEALTCVWALVFSILRLTAQQLNLAWRTFDPLEGGSTNVPQSSDLVYFLESANHLARINRYISGLDEVVAFFDAVRKFQHTQTPAIGTADGQQNLAAITPRSNLESTLAKDSISHARQMCRTYIQQYESQVSLTLSRSTTQIIQQLDSGRKLGDRLAYIGIALAGMTFISTPFVMITGYYGMNVHELVEGGFTTLFEFWQAVLPVLAVCSGVLIIALLRLVREHKRERVTGGTSGQIVRRGSGCLERI